MNTKFTLTTIILTSALLLGFGLTAHAECFIGGNISAEPNTDPAFTDWKYTATITWDTDSQYALSHLDLILDYSTGTCMCDDLSDALFFEGLPGISEGDPMGCEVEYETTLECDGDPSIPGVEGILFKLEPVSLECEPGVTGTLTFTFYSDYSPAPIDEEILLLIDKHGQQACSGTLSGMFPALSCDPVSSQSVSWDAMKGLFR
ncbi:MAG: hypothetical protein KOO60_02115 [Gemmatimonadales bacterium]|nr:hypothetical protein [Gemmatimonadales bacterium]